MVHSSEVGSNWKEKCVNIIIISSQIYGNVCKIILMYFIKKSGNIYVRKCPNVKNHIDIYKARLLLSETLDIELIKVQ